jgi:uncharacterized protein DUF4340
MSPRTLLRLAIALVLLLAIWGAVALGSRGAGDREQRFQLPRIGIKEVDTVTFAGAHDTIVLARTGATAWQVNGHRADSRQVEELLSSLGDTATSGDLVAENPASYGQVGMDSASGRRVRVVAHGKTVADLVVGRPGEMYGTGYLKSAGKPGVYLARSALPRLASRPVDEWRDQRIGGVAKDSVSKVEVQRGSKRYTLTHQAGRWILAPGGNTDSMAVANFLNDLADLRATGFATQAQADSLKFAPPKRRLSVLGPDGKPRLRLAFDSTQGGLWVRADTGTTVWRLEPSSADRITPADTTLKPRPKA